MTCTVGGRTGIVAVMTPSDPVRELAHDHAELNRRVLDLSARVEAMRANDHATSRDLQRPLADLRELLFLHFAREEEGLFPFVAEVDAKLAEQVRAMAFAHDAICGALARMVELATIDAPMSTLLPMFARFESAYAEHARTEVDVLKRLEQRLDSAQRQRLASLVAGL